MEMSNDDRFLHETRIQLEQETGMAAAQWSDGDCVDFGLYSLWRGFCADHSDKHESEVSLSEVLEWVFHRDADDPGVDPDRLRAELARLRVAWSRFERPAAVG